ARTPAAPVRPHQPLGGGIEPADDLVFVDDVAWNVHALEGARNITANRLQARHACDSAVKRTATHRPFWAIFQKDVPQSLLSGATGLRYALPVGFAGLEDVFAAIDFVPNRTERLLLDPGLQLTKELGEIAGMLPEPCGHEVDVPPFVQRNRPSRCKPAGGAHGRGEIGDLEVDEIGEVRELSHSRPWPGEGRRRDRLGFARAPTTGLQLRAPSRAGLARPRPP